MRHEPGHPQRVRRQSGCRPIPPGPGRGRGASARRSHRRLLGARPAQPQAGGQAGRAVAEPFRALRRAVRRRAARTGARAATRRRSPRRRRRPRAHQPGPRRTGAGAPVRPGPQCLRCTPMKTTWLSGRSARERHMQGHPGTQRVAERGHRARRRSEPVPPPPREPAVVGRSARTEPESPCPGRSTATRVCDSASRSPKRPQRRPVWVKPCRRTSGGPEPRTSTWSGTSGERTGHLQRHPGRRVGPARGHRCRRLCRLALDATGAAPGRSAARPRPSRRAQCGVLRPGVGDGDGKADRHLRDERHRRRRTAPGRRRGAPCPGPAHRLHGGPAARAASHRRTAVHRAERPLRRGRPLGLRAGRAGRGPGGHAGDPWRSGPSRRRCTGPTAPARCTSIWRSASR